MEEQETIIIDVQLNDQDIGSRLADINQKMQAVGEETKRMKAAIKDATVGIQENEQAMQENGERLRQLRTDNEAVAEQYAQLGGQIEALAEEQQLQTEAFEAANQAAQDNAAVLSELTQKEDELKLKQEEVSQEYQTVVQDIAALNQSQQELIATGQETSQQFSDNAVKLGELQALEQQLVGQNTSLTKELTSLAEQIQLTADSQTNLDTALQAADSTLQATTEAINQLTAKQKDCSNEMQQYSDEIREIEDENNRLSQSTNDYKEAIAGATYAIAENAAETRALKSEQQTLEGQIRSLGEEDRQYADSLKGMKAELAALRDEYASLSAAERESASGQELLQHIAELDQQVKDTNYSMGEFQANVGNYPQIVTSIIPGFDKVDKALKTMGTSMDKIADKGKLSFKSLTTAVKTFGKAFVSWPIIVIVAVLSAIMLVVNAVRDALKRNDEMLTQVQKSLAILEPILKVVEKSFDLVGKAVAFLIEKLVSAVEWVGRFATKLGILPPVVMETVDAKKALVQAIDDLEEAERNYTVNAAKREMELSDIRAKLADKETYSFEERKQMLEEAQALERQDLEEKKAMAEEHLRILQEQQRLNGDYSDEMADSIAEAQAKVYEATKAFNDGMRELQAEANKLVAEEKKDQEARVKEAKEAYKKQVEIAKKRRKELNDIEKSDNDFAVELMEQGEREYLRILDKEIQEKRNQLAQNKQMTIEEKLALDKEIIELERQRNIQELEMSDRIEAIKAKNALEQFERQTNEKIKQLREEGVLTTEIEKGLLSQLEHERQKYSDQMTQMAAEHAQKEAQINLDAAVKSNDTELKAKVDTYNRDLKLAETVAEKKKLLAKGNATEIQQIDYETALVRQQMLLEMDEETKKQLFANEEEYSLAVAQAEDEVNQVKAQGYTNDLEQLHIISDTRRALAEGDAAAIAQINYEEALAVQEMLLTMDEETKAQLFESEEAYSLAVIEANNRVAESYADVTKKIATQVATYTEACGTILSAVNGVFDSMMEGMDEESEEYKEIARAQALLSFAEIGVQSAVGVAKAIAAGAGVAFPANLAAIASGVAAVLSGIAGAISTYNKYKDYFAEGGIVGGDKYQGDKIVAHLNSGEMVLNKEQQARLFQMANTPRTSEKTMDFDQMVEAFGTALENQPNPILDYTEFTQFTTSVEQKTNKTIIR